MGYINQTSLELGINPIDTLGPPEEVKRVRQRGKRLFPCPLQHLPCCGSCLF